MKNTIIITKTIDKKEVEKNFSEANVIKISSLEELYYQKDKKKSNGESYLFSTICLYTDETDLKELKSQSFIRNKVNAVQTKGSKILFDGKCFKITNPLLQDQEEKLYFKKIAMSLNDIRKAIVQEIKNRYCSIDWELTFASSLEKIKNEKLEKTNPDDWYITAYASSYWYEPKYFLIKKEHGIIYEDKFEYISCKKCQKQTVHVFGYCTTYGH